MPGTPDNRTHPDTANVASPARSESSLVETAEPRSLLSSPPPPFPIRRRLRTGVLLAIGAVVLLIGIVLWRWFSAAPPPLHYNTVLVDRGPVVSMVTATGTVNPVVSVQVGSQVTGKIKELYADFNSVVTKGQLIAQIDPALFQARVASARAALKTARGNLAKARAQLAQRTLELNRMETLRAQQFVPQSDLDLARTNHKDATAQVEVTEAQIDQAAAALSLAELDLGYTKIYSPEDGIVISRKVDVGQTVVASLQAPMIFVIAKDLTKMQVIANVSESDIGGVAEGKAAAFTVDAFPADPFQGVVSQVRNSPVSIQNVVTYDVIVDVDNRALKLKPGMTANVSIVTATKDQRCGCQTPPSGSSCPACRRRRRNHPSGRWTPQAGPAQFPWCPAPPGPRTRKSKKANCARATPSSSGWRRRWPARRSCRPASGWGRSSDSW